MSLTLEGGVECLVSNVHAWTGVDTDGNPGTTGCRDPIPPIQPNCSAVDMLSLPRWRASRWIRPKGARRWEGIVEPVAVPFHPGLDSRVPGLFLFMEGGHPGAAQTYLVMGFPTTKGLPVLFSETFDCLSSSLS